MAHLKLRLSTSQALPLSPGPSAQTVMNLNGTNLEMYCDLCLECCNLLTYTRH